MLGPVRGPIRVGTATRAVAVTGAAVVLATTAFVPSYAGPAVVDVTLSPTSGPVGTTVDVTAPSGLSHVDAVVFGAGTPVVPTDVSDTELTAVVPGDATTGPLTFSYADKSPDAQSDEPFTVQLPTAATIGRSRKVVTVPDSAVVSAVLTSAGLPVQGQRAHLQRTPPGTSEWMRVRDSQVTTSHGRVHWAVTPRDTSAYRVVFADSPSYLGTRTGRVRINVRPLVLLRAPEIMPIYTPTHLHGRVRPAPAGGGRVLLDENIDGTWQRIDRARTGSDGRYSFPMSYAAAGDYVYRVRRPHDALHRSGRSEVARVRAVQRTLRSGMSGPDVRALQHRLKDLHYDVGHIDGAFGYDTLHAVVAFQKVQGTSRDGVVDADVFRSLNKPRPARLRHPDDAATYGVEVDLTRQVVYYAVKGQVRAVLDASSGGGYYYTGSDGVTHKAVTPTGHYSFLYKVNEWQKAPLGELYRPAYFRNDGYAIHGSNSVPPYPASHGCVRITVPAMDRFYDRFVVGMSVWLYRS